MARAWDQVRRNRGAAGIDRMTLADVEQYGVSRLLDELAANLRAGRYRPLPGRRVWIPKPGTEERRPLSIPAVRDRVVQAALKIVLEPIFEADFLPCSFGFRPKRAAQDALQVLIDEAWRGRRWVVETDIASCFEAIPHDRLMAVIEECFWQQKMNPFGNRKMNPPTNALHIESRRLLLHSLSEAIGFTHQFQDVSVMGKAIQ